MHLFCLSDSRRVKQFHSVPVSTCFVYKMSKGSRGLHDGLVKTGKFKEAKVIDDFSPNHISFNSFCAIFDRRLAVSHATLCVEQ